MFDQNGGILRATGSCLCGSLRYAVHGGLREVLICHCPFCRRMNTHVGAYTACAIADLRIENSKTLRWYRASPRARRGFCSKCGSAMFWEPSSLTHISIAVGTLNEPTGLSIREHICTEFKGDYYGLHD